MKTNESIDRDKVLTSLVAHLALGKTEQLACAINAARKEGISEDQIERIRAYVHELRNPVAKAEPSLSDMLANASRSSCC